MGEVHVVAGAATWIDVYSDHFNLRKRLGTNGAGDSADPTDQRAPRREHQLANGAAGRTDRTRWRSSRIG